MCMYHAATRKNLIAAIDASDDDQQVRVDVPVEVRGRDLDRGEDDEDDRDEDVLPRAGVRVRPSTGYGSPTSRELVDRARGGEPGVVDA